MKYSNLIIICVLTISSLSCSKSQEEKKLAHPLEQLIGRWVPVEYVIDGRSILDIESAAFFGFYANAFEVKDTSGVYQSAFYLKGEFGYTGYKGNLTFNQEMMKISFQEDNLSTSLHGKVEKINDNEMWILFGNSNLIKLKKI